MTSPTEKQLKLSLLTVGLLALLGMAWNSKANVSDVDAIAADVRDIKTMLCRTIPDDSMCHRRTP